MTVSGFVRLIAFFLKYFGDALTELKLNNGIGAAAATAYGVTGSPVMVDADNDGVVDRLYLADSNGREQAPIRPERFGSVSSRSRHLVRRPS